VARVPDGARLFTEQRDRKAGAFGRRQCEEQSKRPNRLRSSRLMSAIFFTENSGLCFSEQSVIGIVRTEVQATRALNRRVP